MEFSDKIKQFVKTKEGQALLQQSGSPELIKQFSTDMRKVTFIRPNGITKTKVVDFSIHLIHAVEPVILQLKDCKMVYDAKNKTINKKASQLAGQQVGGLVLLYNN